MWVHLCHTTHSSHTHAKGTPYKFSCDERKAKEERSEEKPTTHAYEDNSIKVSTPTPVARSLIHLIVSPL